MSTPYETELFLTTTGANQIVQVPLPGRCFLDRVAVARPAGGAITMTLFNRNFTPPAQGLKWITADSTGGFAQLFFLSPFAAKVGDLITVAGSGVSGYNVPQRVTVIVDDRNIVTSKTYISDDYTPGETAGITIPAAEQPIYQVLQLTGTNSAVVEPTIPYVNLDPLLNRNIGVNRIIYAQFAAADSYRLAIRVRDGIATG